ncbi:MAG: hypothetical protein FWD37_00165, partial [Methanomassiliicoccaceae archaeon]|nr:hypothetical protein [Methanomassiliicoccaceae archaeon]
MRYATVLKNIDGDVFCRQDVLNALLKEDPRYNSGSFNRHFSKMISCHLVENVGENLYIATSPDAAKGVYYDKDPSTELSDLRSFLDAEFPIADFLVWELRQLNEFLNHQIAQSTIIVMVERMLMDAVF